MTQFPESVFWLALAYASGLKLARIKTIVTAWCLEGEQPLSALFKLPPGKVAARLGLSAEEAGQVAAAAERISEYAAWLARLEGDNVELITRTDSYYPPALTRSLPLAMQPLLLFCRGDVGMLSRPSAAVIGARDAGAETIGFVRELATLLAEEGLTVVSGLGRGVGRAAFEGALSAEGGQAVAVLPMGISAFLRPQGNAAQETTYAVEGDGALLVSPFHPDARFTEALAVARNSLIVRLSEATFVVASGETGVAREAADEALRLGKAVYVWDVDPTVEPAAGGNRVLIKAGATPITSVPDILDAVEAVVETLLDLPEEGETPPIESPILALREEPEAPFDPQSALDLLSRAGQVPEALARRLRGD
jgi:DNA protecting protein DprA